MNKTFKKIALAAGVTAAAAVGFHYVNKELHKDICMIAHRGHSGKHPGNTEAAFLSAVQNGSGGIETDVRMTADGVFVVNHNDEATFEDGTELVVAESTFEELSKKPLKNDKSDEVVYICTFQRYLEICRDADMICFIELKGEFSDEDINRLFTMAGEIYDLKKCSLQSFEFENLVKAHEAFPDLQIMLTYGKNCGDYHKCIDYGFDIDADYKVATPKMVKEFHDKGLRVGLWTANDIPALNFCRLLGVDYIESDYFGSKL